MGTERAQFMILKRHLPPILLIRDFSNQNAYGNVSKISVNHTWYTLYGDVSFYRD